MKPPGRLFSLVIGDALCHFNPTYAQGMSAAAKQAAILQETLSEYAEQSLEVRCAVPRFVKGSLGFEIVYLTRDSKWASQKAV
jgi:flavin-dependent dehydrogenase